MSEMGSAGAETTPRVVSLAPSSTATLTAMGAGDCLVGVTAHCDFDAPVVGGWLNPNYDRLAELDPDLVCTSDDLQSEIRDELRERGYAVYHDEPERLTDVVESFESLGSAVGRPAAGEQLAEASRARLETVATRVPSDSDSRPIVYCEEWSDPPMAAGNWVPDAVAAAGGRCPFVKPGERSREVSREVVEGAAPDHVVLHLCGHGDRVSPGLFSERGWDVDATVHVLDDSLLNQPSPNLLDGIEALADLLHSDSHQHADTDGGH
ncbi:Fe3+-hydroxamate ABC transporter substrate-binding protein [Halogeometricum borinquense DSM 11551]|uniref:Fe3+-hydroxamate ABC transporter substrate-binding protein n=2 Tax=Halogeometricum borinquense (strain ATCC 700274 / DSM 11551 / JCM 10706 / KCTC 4070 / PR3) TaxID=469382 RepID=L9UGM7_HALBP|nr:cobalamin-binding protein [Halogeometricum borinquense]ELY24100.1 Fe3+-hydroxamate ABC transporter substrate-binding protein [Halogeometricum borinquense DSM 11551]